MTTRYGWIVPFAATVIAMMTMQMSSLGFSPLLPAIQKEYGVNYSQIGFFTGVYGLVAIVMSIPGGMLAKRIGEHKALTFGLVGIAVGLFSLSQAPTFALGLSSRVIWLCGYRISFVCVMTAVAMASPAWFKSSAMGILGAMSSLASVIGAPFGSTIGGIFGWRLAIAAFGGMALLGAAIFWLLYRRNPEGSAATSGHGSVGVPDASAFRNPYVWALVLLGLTNMGGFSATFFVPSAVKSVFDLEPREAAKIISASYFFAIFANLLCGYLADRFNRWWVMSALMVVLIPSSFAMMTTNLLVFRAATALVISLGLCATNQIYPLAGEIMSGKNTGPVMGIASLGGGVFGFLGPQMLGYLRDRTGGFVAGWYFVAAGATLSLFVVLTLRFFTERARKTAALEAMV